MVSRISGRLVTAQVFAATAALAAMALWPPVAGRLLLVPVMPGAAGPLVRAAVAGGALLVGAGPLPGSQVVIGDRAAIARRIDLSRILILAAPPAGCDAANDPEGSR